jgi:hypothetical protein
LDHFPSATLHHTINALPIDGRRAVDPASVEQAFLTDHPASTFRCLDFHSLCASSSNESVRFNPAQTHFPRGKNLADFVSSHSAILHWNNCRMSGNRALGEAASHEKQIGFSQKVKRDLVAISLICLSERENSNSISSISSVGEKGTHETQEPIEEGIHL